MGGLPGAGDRRAASVGARPTVHCQPAGPESFVLTYSTSGSAEAPSVVSLAPFSDPAPEQWVDRDRH
jgi:hypothetical protein